MNDRCWPTAVIPSDASPLAEGLVSNGEAKQLGRPVKLQINRVGDGCDFRVDWVDVPKGKHVQGCLTRKGAYALVEEVVRVV